MFPVLFEISSFTIYSYGFFIAIGYLSSITIGVWLGKKEGLDPAKLVDLGFYLLLFGFLGARILFIITRWDHYIANPAEIFYIWEGGLVFLGGFLLSLAFCIWYLHRNKMPVLTVLDLGAPAITIGHAFGRLGCLAAGCCHGKFCELPWAIVLNSTHVQKNLQGLPIHPTQIYSATGLFLLGGAMIYVWHKRKFRGQVSLIYLTLYPVLRSIIEIYRGDSIRGYIIPGYVTTSQFISFLIFTAAITAYFVMRSRPEFKDI